MPTLNTYRVMNGAKIRFQLNFTVPMGSDYTKLIITDELVSGLNLSFTTDTDFIDNIVSLSINGTEVDKTEYETYFTTTGSIAADPATATKAKLVLTTTTATAIMNALKATKQDSIFSLILETEIEDMEKMYNADTKQYELTNDYTIEAYQNAALIDTQKAGIGTVLLTPYRIYGFGSSDTIKRTANTAEAPNMVNLPIYIPTFDGFSSDIPEGTTGATTPKCINYELTFTVNPQLNIQWPADELAFVTGINDYLYVYAETASGAESERIPFRQFDPDAPEDTVEGYVIEIPEYTPTEHTFKISVPHFNEFRNHTLYIVMVLPAGDNTDESIPSTLFSQGTVDLNNACTSGIIQSSDPFNVTTILQDQTSLIDLSKTIVL